MTGFTHGFADSQGVETVLDDPAGTPPNVMATAQNLLGVNAVGQAAGFWMDNQGLEHGFVVNIHGSRFTEISPRLFPGAVATQASDINDSQYVCGFWTDANGDNHDFTGRLGGSTRPSVSRFPVPRSSAHRRSAATTTVTSSARSRMAAAVSTGSSTTMAHSPGTTPPGSSQFPAFNVSGTLINGIDDEGDFVGFFSDGTKVNGFVKLATSLAK